METGGKVGLDWGGVPVRMGVWSLGKQWWWNSDFVMAFVKCA